MAQIAFMLNGAQQIVDVSPEMPLLWVLRDVLGLTGTKYGCGLGACGACTAHLDGEPIRACNTPAADVSNRNVTTVEGLLPNGSHPVQQAWLAEDVPQCGYCQAGQIMQATALLEQVSHPSDADIDQAMEENICRCGTYQRIRAAIHRAAKLKQSQPVDDGSQRSRPDIAVRLSPWIGINSDNSVTIFVSKAEMGQGVRTALAMVVAEELDVAWSQVHVEQAPLDPVFGDQATIGSFSIMRMWEPLRKAGASARAQLVAAAASQWTVAADTCETSAGTVIHTQSGRSIPYVDIADAATTVSPPEDVTLKPAADFALIGRPIARIDNPQIVTGEAQFGMDVRLPGMLYAVVARCPVKDGQLVDFDAAAAKAVPGVRDVLVIDSGIAVVAETTWAAMVGREALTIDWDEGENAAVDTANLRERLHSVLDPAEPMPDDATLVVEASYELPLLAHAAMEPLNCVADVREDRCDIWAPVQHPEGARLTAAQLTGLPPDAVSVRQTLLGGGFGRKAAADAVGEAVQVSQQIGTPVQLVWSRIDDMQHDRYRPPSLHMMRGAIGQQANITAWSHGIAIDGIRHVFDHVVPGMDTKDFIRMSAQHSYSIPDSTIEIELVDLPISVWPWRSVFLSQTVFANESFMDELAVALDRDPYELRREHIQSPRLRRTLDVAAERGDWGREMPPGSGQGIACFAGLGSFISSVVELHVKGKEISVQRITCAVDCGIAVNPRSIEAQIQGAVADGMATALKAEVTMRRGRVEQGSFLDFEWIRMGDMPVVEVHIIPSQEEPGGVGELGYPPVPPAIANALFAACGRRIRRLPIRL